MTTKHVLKPLLYAVGMLCMAASCNKQQTTLVPDEACFPNGVHSKLENATGVIYQGKSLNMNDFAWVIKFKTKDSPQESYVPIDPCRIPKEIKQEGDFITFSGRVPQHPILPNVKLMSTIVLDEFEVTASIPTKK